MKINRIAAAVAAAALAGIAVPASAVPTTSTCSFTVRLPPVIGFSSNVQSIPAVLSGNCPAAASYHLKVDLEGSDSFNSEVRLGPLLYDKTNTSATFPFSGCNGPYDIEDGHYAATLVSADVRDSQGNPITQVQLSPSSTVAENSAVAYSASSRRGNAVYLNGLAKIFGFGFVGRPPMENCGFVRDPGYVYLQRLLNGSWQTMLVRNSYDGVVTAAFVQSKVYQYRWVVLGQPSEPVGYAGPSGLVGSASASTVR